MSYAAMEWAHQQQLPALAKLTLLCLANRHNKKTGRCDPSIETLARDSGMSTDSVRRALRSLKRASLIEIRSRKRGTICLSNAYELRLPAEALARSEKVVAAGERVPASSYGGTSQQQSGVLAPSETNREIKPRNEPAIGKPFETEDVPTAIAAGRFSVNAVSEERYSAVVEMVRATLSRKQIVFAWGPREGRQLKTLLSNFPREPLEFFERCLRHWSQSEVNHAAPIHSWLNALPTFQKAPQDRYKTPKGPYDERKNGSSAAKDSPHVRNERSRASIANVFQRIRGDDPGGTADATDETQLSRAGDRRRDDRDVGTALAGTSDRVRTASHARGAQGTHANVTVLSSPVRVEPRTAAPKAERAG